MTTETEKQFQIEAERSMAMIEQAIAGMEQFGGDVNLFAYAQLKASLHLFVQVRGFPELEQAINQLLAEEQKRRRPSGRA